MNGAILVNKHAGVSSFGVIELLQRDLMQRGGLKRRDLPKIGHGGTLDPFATGLLAVCVGKAVKLARYFLGSQKIYEGTLRFGQTTVPGDPTSPVSETSSRIPSSREELQELATKLTLQPYLQTPPMHSAKKLNGKPLYELAREGLEVEREPKLCHLYEFEILSYEAPLAKFRIRCSSGTYVRTLAQDFGRMLGSVAMLDALHRTGSGIFSVDRALSCEQIVASGAAGQGWDELPCWAPFDRLLDGYLRADATREEKEALLQGRQNVLFNILKRVEAPRSGLAPANESQVAIYHEDSLVAVASQELQGAWGIERVFA